MKNQTQDDQLIFNGINGSTGGYLFPELTTEDIAKVAKGEKLDPDTFRQVTGKLGQKAIKGGDEVARDLATAGWGFIISMEMENRDAILEALRPLIEYRKQQAGDGLFKTMGYEGGKDRDPGYWLARYGASTGDVQPDVVPYYLMIIGSLEDIPFEFQYVLDVNYAVGRLYFDTVEEYAQYANKVLEREQQQVQVQERFCVFGVKNPHDKATESSIKYFLPQVYQRFRETHPDWETEVIVRQEATKAHLSDVINAPKPPGFLISASHGMGFDISDERQISDQGALLCSDWPGQFRWGTDKPIPEDFYFSARDINESTDLQGMIAFLFACYSGATPKYDNFKFAATGDAEQIAPHNFISALPKRMLTAGAGAVITHLDRAWGHSFLGQKGVDNTATINGVIDELLKGRPVGYAMQHINDYYAFEESRMGEMQDSVQYNPEYVVDQKELARTYMRKNDARNYLLLGDPAIKLLL